MREHKLCILRLDREAGVEGEFWRGAMGGGGGGSPPPPSQAEIEAQQASTELNKFQLAQAKTQAGREEALLPFFIQASGYQLDPYSGEGAPLEIGGNKFSVTQKPDPLKDLNDQIAQVSGERLLKAAGGELEIDPSVEADIARGKESLKEELLRRLGPGYGESDSGVRALSEYDRQSNALRYDVRRGEMSSADAILYNQQSASYRRNDQYQASLANAAAWNVPSSSSIARASEAHQNFARDRRDERLQDFNIRSQSAAARGAGIGSMIGGLGSAAVIGGYAL